ncbi:MULTISPECIES: hypothetical protein [Phyllobacteriaceae]|nr:hypothetical protein [Mesorhizobium sp. RMAD-H1]MBB2970772.1 hypothetical protein [Mesorhizobium sp. RMAD-H1]
MTNQTIPADIYQRHEREWQILRKSLAAGSPPPPQPQDTQKK